MKDGVQVKKWDFFSFSQGSLHWQKFSTNLRKDRGKLRWDFDFTGNFGLKQVQVTFKEIEKILLKIGYLWNQFTKKTVT